MRVCVRVRVVVCVWTEHDGKHGHAAPSARHARSRAALGNEAMTITSIMGMRTAGGSPLKEAGERCVGPGRQRLAAHLGTLH